MIPEHDEETGEVKFSASSPDDEALVCGAKFFGFDFIDRKQGNATLKLSTGEEKTYKIMEMIEFNSDRKRMSVVVKKDDCIELYSKGADTVMIPRLKGNQEKVRALVAVFRRFHQHLFLTYTYLPRRSCSRTPAST